MSRPARIMIVDEGGGECAVLCKAIDDVEWNADVDSIHLGKIAINVLYRNYAKQLPTDLVIMICSYNTLACLDTIRIIKDYPGISNQPIIVFSNSAHIDYIVKEYHKLGVIKVLEMTKDYSQTIIQINEIKSYFTQAGNLTPHGSWINRNRFAKVKEMTAGIEQLTMKTVGEISS